MKRFWLLFFSIAFIILLALDFLLIRGKEAGEFPWSGIPGFFIIFGFIVCVAVVAISKLIGHYWLQKREDHYDRNDSDE